MKTIFKKFNIKILKLLYMVFTFFLVSQVGSHADKAGKPTADLIKNELSKNGYTLVSNNSFAESEFGNIFLAKSINEKTVCLKCLFNNHFSKNEFEIFENEQIINCENIAQTNSKIDIKSNSNDIIILVIDFINGKNLMEKWTDPTTKKFSIFNKIEVLNMLKDISNALKLLHETGYIHKDIKPANIMFDYNKNNYKLIDFGSCSPINGKKDCRGCIAYRAPEFFLFMGKRVNDYNEKVDVWALGTIVCHLFKGALPYELSASDGKGLLKIDLIIQNQNNFIKNLPDFGSDEISNVISKCIIFDPNQRISSKELYELLK